MAIPQWFWDAVEAPRHDDAVEVDEADVTYTRWDGPAGAPGLLLVHGMNAHRRWWDFIAPQLIDQYQVAALDLAGMGDADDRYDYSAELWAQSLVAVADAAGLPGNTLIVGHSFGGRIGLEAAARHSDRFAGLVLVDAGVRDPAEAVDHSGPRVGGRPVLYPDAQTAQQRFRLQPPQSCEHEFLLTYIAKHSVMAIDGGYAFKFDTDMPEVMTGVDRDRAEANLRALTLPLGLIYGEDSELFSKNTLGYMESLRPFTAPPVGLAKAQHHLFLDQPLAFIDALR
ncbi:MAG: alpha/beta fold hydrolase, partial [Pseudomonadales bacterium]